MFLLKKFIRLNKLNLQKNVESERIGRTNPNRPLYVLEETKNKKASRETLIGPGWLSGRKKTFKNLMLQSLEARISKQFKCLAIE